MSRMLDLYWETEPPPWWRRALTFVRGLDAERASAYIAVGYCSLTIVALACWLRP